jgi:ParB family chromosome partitioning protein
LSHDTRSTAGTTWPLALTTACRRLVRSTEKLSVGRDTVDAAATVAESSTAFGALESGQLSLTEAAALTEFIDGDDDAVQALLAVAGKQTFEHRVAQLRQDRIASAARAHAETAYADKGFTVLEQRPQWRDTTTVSLRHLHTADGQEASEAAVTDPAHWAVLMTEDTVLVDADTGEPVDEADVDWSTEHQPDREPARGTRHASTVVEATVWQPEYYCTDPEACGLAMADFLTRSGPIVHEPTAVEDPEASAESQRAERRKVLALNKLGAAAQEVRRAWVRDGLLARKTPVKGAAVFVATCLEHGPGVLVQHAERQIAGELLGLGETPLRAAVDKLPATGDARAQVLLLGIVLAALEGRTPKDAWRAVSGDYRPVPGPAEDLRFLAANGYALSAIEQVITGERDAASTGSWHTTRDAHRPPVPFTGSVGIPGTIRRSH